MYEQDLGLVLVVPYLPIRKREMIVNSLLRFLASVDPFSCLTYQRLFHAYMRSIFTDLFLYLCPCTIIINYIYLFVYYLFIYLFTIKMDMVHISLLSHILYILCNISKHVVGIVRIFHDWGGGWVSEWWFNTVSPCCMIGLTGPD